MYPREVKYYICSDGRTFQTIEEANDYEDFLQSEYLKPVSYTNWDNDPFNRFDVRF